MLGGLVAAQRPRVQTSSRMLDVGDGQAALSMTAHDLNTKLEAWHGQLVCAVCKGSCGSGLLVA
eukprot:263480-Chlamydomonas_euryale.AAC.1